MESAWVIVSGVTGWVVAILSVLLHWRDSRRAAIAQSVRMRIEAAEPLQNQPDEPPVLRILVFNDSACPVPMRRMGLFSARSGDRWEFPFVNSEDSQPLKSVEALGMACVVLPKPKIGVGGLTQDHLDDMTGVWIEPACAQPFFRVLPEVPLFIDKCASRDARGSAARHDAVPELQLPETIRKAADNTPAGVPRRMEGLTVLWIDPDPSARAEVMKLAAAEGAIVVTVSNEDAACTRLRMVKDDPFQVIVCTLERPSGPVSGLGEIERLREQKLHDGPVIAYQPRPAPGAASKASTARAQLAADPQGLVVLLRMARDHLEAKQTLRRTERIMTGSRAPVAAPLHVVGERGSHGDAVR